MIDERPRCQSCGQPIGSFPSDDGDTMSNIAKERDGNLAPYCTLCYRDGDFTEPTLTLPAMINRSIGHMTRELGFPMERATRLANELLPTLARWK